MKKLELKDLHDGFEVLEEGQAVGRVVKHSPMSFSWQAYLAKPPFTEGKCDSEVGALAHLGFKRRKSK